LKIEFGHYLFERKYFEEAGLMYQQAGEFDLSIKSFLETTNHHMLFSVCLAHGVSNEKFKEITLEFVAKLEEKKNISEAGSVLADYNFNQSDL